MIKRALTISVLTVLCFSMKYCVDPCEVMDCANGGICDGGQCNCPEGYYGRYCTGEEEIDEMWVVKFEVSGFDHTYDGGPDIYLWLEEDQNGSGSADVVIYSSNVINNVSSPGTYTFTPDNPIKLNPEGWYNLDLRVYDAETFSSYHHQLGTAGLHPYKPGEGFPATKLEEDSNRGVQFTSTFTYTWK